MSRVLYTGFRFRRGGQRVVGRIPPLMRPGRVLQRTRGKVLVVGERRQPYAGVPPEGFHVGRRLADPLPLQDGGRGCYRRRHNPSLQRHALPRRFRQRNQLDVLHAGAPLAVAQAGAGVDPAGGLAGALLWGSGRFADGPRSRRDVPLGVAPDGRGYSGVSPPGDIGRLAVDGHRHSQVGARVLGSGEHGDVFVISSNDLKTFS